MRGIAFTGLVFLFVAGAALAGAAGAVCPQYMGARIIANDGTFLGTVAVPQEKESIFNAYGPYGSKTSKTSIFNVYSPYGSASSPQSAFNPYATKPPVIQKGGKNAGILSVNTALEGAISVNKLISICRG